MSALTGAVRQGLRRVARRAGSVAVDRLHALTVTTASATHAAARRAARSPAHAWGWFTLYLPNTEKPLFARPATSDLQCFQAVFSRRQHDFPLDTEPRVIIDLGANVGYTSVDFALRYPTATVVAVEPEPANAALLRLNTAGFPQIHVVEAAVWPRRTRLALEDVGNDRWGFQVREGDGARTARAVTVPDVMAEVGADAVDLLKIDIEGAEHELFAENAEWLAVVRSLYVEFHEMRPGATAASEETLARYGFERRAEIDENRYYARPKIRRRTARRPTLRERGTAALRGRRPKRLRVAVARAAAIAFSILLVFGIAPEALGDWPYDPFQGKLRGLYEPY